ncbi:HIRAN domain-containing protein [Tsuneonella sp. HG094]
MPKSYSVGIVGESNYQAAIRNLREGERVFLQPEPDNPHDPRAIAVRDGEGQTIGYIPRDSWLTGAIIDEGKGSRALVERIDGGDRGRPSLGVVLAVELGEKGAPVVAAAKPASAVAPAQGERNRHSVRNGLIGIGGLVLVLAMCTPDDAKDGGGADALPSGAASSALGAPVPESSAGARGAEAAAAIAKEKAGCEKALAGLTDTGLIREREGDTVVVEDANWAGLPYRDKVNVLRAVVCVRTGKFEPVGSDKASAYAYRSGDRLLTLTPSGAF